MTRRKTRSDDNWFCATDCARFIGTTGHYFSRTLAPLVAIDDRQRDGRTVWYYAPALMQALIDRESRKLAVAAGVSESSDPDLFGGGSETPALRRLRTTRGDLEDLKLQERRAELVNVEQVVRGLTGWREHVRRSLDALQRRFGRDAYDLIVDALDEGDRYLAGLRKGR